MSKLLGNEILGENIKRIRLARGLTQEQTIARLQVLGSPLSRSTYSLIEMGRGNIFVNDLVGLQQVCHVSYKEFSKIYRPPVVPNNRRRNKETAPCPLARCCFASSPLRLLISILLLFLWH